MWEPVEEVLTKLSRFADYLHCGSWRCQMALLSVCSSHGSGLHNRLYLQLHCLQDCLWVESTHIRIGCRLARHIAVVQNLRDHARLIETRQVAVATLAQAFVPLVCQVSLTDQLPWLLRALSQESLTTTKKHWSGVKGRHKTALKDVTGLDSLLLSLKNRSHVREQYRQEKSKRHIVGEPEAAVDLAEMSRLKDRKNQMDAIISGPRFSHAIICATFDRAGHGWQCDSHYPTVAG